MTKFSPIPDFVVGALRVEPMATWAVPLTRVVGGALTPQSGKRCSCAAPWAETRTPNAGPISCVTPRRDADSTFYPEVVTRGPVRAAALACGRALQADRPAFFVPCALLGDARGNGTLSHEPVLSRAGQSENRRRGALSTSEAPQPTLRLYRGTFVHPGARA